VKQLLFRTAKQGLRSRTSAEGLPNPSSEMSGQFLIQPCVIIQNEQSKKTCHVIADQLTWKKMIKKSFIKSIQKWVFPIYKQVLGLQNILI